MATHIDLTGSDDEPSLPPVVRSSSPKPLNSEAKFGHVFDDAKTSVPLRSSQLVGQGSKHSPLTFASDSDQDADARVRSRRNADVQSGSGGSRRIAPKITNTQHAMTPHSLLPTIISPPPTNSATGLKRRRNALQPSSPEEPNRKKPRSSTSLHLLSGGSIPSDSAVSSEQVKANSKVIRDSGISGSTQTTSNVSPHPSTKNTKKAKKLHENFSSKLEGTSKVGNGGRDEVRQLDPHKGLIRPAKAPSSNPSTSLIRTVVGKQARLSTPMSLQDHHSRLSDKVLEVRRSSSVGPGAAGRCKPPTSAGRRGAVTVASLTSVFSSPTLKDSRVAHKSPIEHTNAESSTAVDVPDSNDEPNEKEASNKEEEISTAVDVPVPNDKPNDKEADKEACHKEDEHMEDLATEQITSEMAKQQIREEGSAEGEEPFAKMMAMFHESRTADARPGCEAPAQVHFRGHPPRRMERPGSEVGTRKVGADCIQHMPGVDIPSVEGEAHNLSEITVEPTKDADELNHLETLHATLVKKKSVCENLTSMFKSRITFLNFSEVRPALDKHLKNMHQEHERMVQSELSQAQLHAPIDDIQAIRPGIKLQSYNGMVGLAHRSSPFSSMQAIESRQKAAVKDQVLIHAEAYSAEGRVIAKNDVFCPTSTYAAHNPIVPGYTGEMPNSSHYVSINRNILGANTRQMHVWPYFGIEDGDEIADESHQATLRDHYDVDVNEWPRKVHRAQQVRAYTAYVEAFLQEIGSSMNDILYYLLDPVDPDDPVAKVIPKNCRTPSEICREDFTEKFKSTRWVKVLSRLTKPTEKGLTKAAIACTAFRDAAHASSKHTQDLTMWHIARKSALARLPEDDLETDIADVACEICYLHDCPYHGEMREKETLSDASDEASIASEDALDTDYPPNYNYKIPVALPFQDLALKGVAKRASKQQKQKGVVWWLENSLSWDHAKRGPFFPCSHPGLTCDQAKCRCFKEEIHCEKACGCLETCERRYRGCTCRQDNNRGCFQDDKCECFRLNRECDPDLCGSCGVDLVLDRDSATAADESSTCCKNAGIQRGRPKRAILGASKVHGYGLFAGEPIKRDDFVGEYVGEIITKAETERRGAIYEVQKSSYLFVLNRDQELDSQRYGNKIRFINHANVGSRHINVYPKVMLCNMAHRIGMFALKDIEVGEELFFDYGEQYHDNLKSKALLDSHSDPEDHHSPTAKSAARKQSSRPALKGESRAGSQSASNKLSTNTKLPAARKSESSVVGNTAARKTEGNGIRRSIAINNVIIAGRNKNRLAEESRSRSNSNVPPPKQEPKPKPVARVDDELMPDAEAPLLLSNSDDSDYNDEREVADSEDDDSDDDGDSDDDEDAPRRSLRARRRSQRALAEG